MFMSWHFLVQTLPKVSNPIGGEKIEKSRRNNISLLDSHVEFYFKSTTPI